MEEHSPDHQEPVNTIVAIPIRSASEDGRMLIRW
jgi:hypothetical protein